MGGWGRATGRPTPPATPRPARSCASPSPAPPNRPVTHRPSPGPAPLRRTGRSAVPIAHTSTTWRQKRGQSPPTPPAPTPLTTPARPPPAATPGPTRPPPCRPPPRRARGDGGSRGFRWREHGEEGRPGGLHAGRGAPHVRERREHVGGPETPRRPLLRAELRRTPERVGAQRRGLRRCASARQERPDEPREQVARPAGGQAAVSARH